MGGIGGSNVVRQQSPKKSRIERQRHTELVVLT
jgi:hypothetical protein